MMNKVVYRVAQKSKLLTQYNSLLFWATLYINVRLSPPPAPTCRRPERETSSSCWCWI